MLIHALMFKTLNYKTNITAVKYEINLKKLLYINDDAVDEEESEFGVIINEIT